MHSSVSFVRFFIVVLVLVLPVGQSFAQILSLQSWSPSQSATIRTTPQLAKKLPEASSNFTREFDKFLRTMPMPQSTMQDTLAEQHSSGIENEEAVKRRALEEFNNPASRRHLSFIENKGQWADSVLYCARMGGLTMWLMRDGVLYDFHRRISKPNNPENLNNPRHAHPRHAHDSDRVEGHVVKMRFDGGKTITQFSGIDKQHTYHNYFLGADSTKWRSNVPLWSEVRLADVYAGVDVRFYEDAASPRFDYIVKPGADAHQIALAFEGTDKARVGDDGKLHLATSLGDVALQGLYAYQEVDGKKKQVACEFILKSGKGSEPSLTFALGAYNPALPLVIDPLVYSTYIGGMGVSSAKDIALDASGRAVVLGDADGGGFPLLGAYQGTYGGGTNDIVVSRLNATGTMLDYSTYLGGNDSDTGNRIALDASGNMVIIGTSFSTNYPITMMSAFQSLFAGVTDIVVSKLNAAGTTLLYSTYIGGNNQDDGGDIAIDTGGNIVIVGTGSIGYPLVLPAQMAFGYGTWDIVVTKFTSAGAVVYSTYIGGGGIETGTGIALDASNNAVIVGYSTGSFPTTGGVVQGGFGGVEDIVVSKLSPAGAILYSTYLGGAGSDAANAVAIDAGGNAIITGDSDGSYPTTIGAYQTTFGGMKDVVVSKLNPTGSALLYSTYIGGAAIDLARAIAVDGDGNAVIVGWSEGSYPTTIGAYQTVFGTGGNDAIVSRLSATGAVLLYSTYIGGNTGDIANGVALRANDHAVIAGLSGGNFPTTPLAFQPMPNGAANIVVASLSMNTYVWNGSISNDYQNPNNWGPMPRTTPLPTDDIIFDPPTSTVQVVTNIPSQTVNNLIINNSGGPGNIVRFQSSTSRTLTVNGSFTNSARVEVGDVTQLNELSAITIVLRGASNNQPASGAITLGKQASIRLENGAAFTINGVVRTSRADGINGTSALAGAFQLGTGGGTLIYGAVGTYSFVGYGNQTANFAAVAGKPAISSIAGDIQIDKPGGTAAANAEVTINSDMTIQGFNWGTFPNRACFIPSGVTVTTTMPNTWAGTIKMRIAGQFINGMGVTVSAGGEIEMIGTAGWMGAVPTFNTNTSLRYTGAGNVMTSIVPTTMNGKLYVQKSSGDLPITGPPQTFNDSVVVASRLVFPVNSVALGASGQVEIRSGGTLQFAGAAATLTAPNATNRVVVRNGGTLERVAGAGTIGSPNPTLVYEVGSTLLYSGTGNITTGTELPLFPAPVISNLNVNNAGTLTCSSPFPLRLEGTSTIGTASVMQIVGPTSFSGPLTLNGIIKIPVASSNLLFNGPLLLNGSIDATGVSSSVQMQFNGSGSVTGTLGFIGNTYNGRIFLNRPGMRLVLGSSLNSGGITFTQGVLVVNPPNLLTLTNVSVIGILGGNAHSYVDGMLARNLPTNQTMPDTWLFPVGKNGRYLPVSIVSPKTGGNAPLVQAEAFTGATGGRADSTLNSLLSGTYWNVNLVSGDILSTRIRLESDAPTIPLNAVVAKSPTLTGAYTSIGRDFVSATRIVSAPFTGFSTFTLGTPFVPPPPTVAITNFSPLSGTSGTTVIINGANFSTVTGVFFGGVPVQSFTVDSASQIRAIVGSGASGAVTVRTMSFSSATTATQFTFIGAPTITNIQPPIVGINQDIVITGTNFFTTTNASQGASLLVSMGNVTASSVVINSPTQITVRFQAITSGTLTVRAQGGTVTSSQMLSVVPPPTITGFSPSAVPQNSVLTVTGANFIQNQTQVRLNGFVLPATVNSPTRVSVQIPANAQSGTLTFTTPGGTTTSNQQLTVLQAPTITAAQPTSGIAGTPFTITGQNLALSGILLVGGVQTAFTLNSTGTVITALFPGLPNDVFSSQASISFTTLGGTATFGQSLTILPPAQPTITSIEPNPILEGAPALIRLAGTTATTSIGELSIGGIVVTNVVVQADGSIRFTVPSGVVSRSATQSQAAITLTTTQNGRTSSTTAALALTVQAANLPALTGFSPQAGSSTTTLTITGQNFGIAPRGSIQAVLVGGVPVQSFSIVSPNEIRVMLGTVQSGAITVQTSSGELSTSGTFTFDPRFIPSIPVSAQDSIALVALYRATGGASWTNRTNWLIEPVSTWFGVVLANGRVAELRLPANALRGVVPVVELQALSGLRVLELSGNALSGDVSALLPTLTFLESLNLSNTELSGTLAGICPLANLRTINLANCRFEGTLEPLCCLNRVELLNVSNNLFSGTIPVCFGEKPTLTVFDASNNQLSGELPRALGASETLQVLNLRGNRLTGSIPAAWGAPAGKVRASAHALTGLQRLDLAQNQLSGALPPELGALKNVRELSLAGNRFSGAIPASMLGMIRLRVLDVSNNQLSEAPNFTTISRMDTLAMQNNLFDFATLEQQLIPLQAAPTRAFRYAPQNTVLAITGATTAVLDSELTLRINARGSQNTYRWRLDSNALSGTTSASLVNARCTSEMAGTYQAEVRSALLPQLTLPTQPLTVRFAQPATAPQELVRLLEPSAGATDVSPVPNFAWSSVRGAGVYRFELARAQDFTSILATTTIEQSAEILAAARVARSGQMLADIAGAGTTPFPLQALTQYFWRVRAENVLGNGAFASGSFITAGRDAVLGADKVEFGRIARLDTGVGVFTVRNITAAPVRLIALASTNPAFAFDAVQNLAVPVGGSARVRVLFLPQTLVPQEADVRMNYAIGTSTNAQAQVLTARLAGSASGLKVIPPRFDTVLAGQTRIASAQVINRGDRTAVLKRLSIEARGGEYDVVSQRDKTGLAVGANDTIAVPLRVRATQVGRVPTGLMRYEAEFEGNLRATPPVAVLNEVVNVALNAFARSRTGNEPTAHVGIRVKESEKAQGIAPGASVTLEVFLAGGNRNSLVQRTSSLVSGTLRYDRNVLVLTEQERSVRRIRNTAAQNRFERLALAPTRWDGRSEVLATIQCRAVAGDVDTTAIELENIVWEGAELDDFVPDVLRLSICTAGGKRLVTSAKATQLAAIAPNPAKDEVSISYTLREDGFVEIAMIDASGKIAQILVSEEQAAGEYSITKALKNVPSGAYTVRFSTQNGVVTKRVSVVR